MRHCIENPEVLKTKGMDGFTLADTIASYGPPDVVKQLLDSARKNPEIEKVLAKSHELDGGIETEALTLAIATLRHNGEDDSPYMDMVERLKSGS